MDRTSSARQVVRLVLAAAVVAAVFAFHFRYLLLHFSAGGTPLDSGWFAWLLGEGDVRLINPRVINDLSYYTVHVSPYLSAWSVLLHPAGLDRFTVFALHQGLVFGLLAASILGLVFAARWPVFVAAMLFVLGGDLVLQYAALPHFEIGVLAFGLCGVLLWRTNHRAAGTLAFAVACLVREDGGLFVAALLAAVALAGARRPALRSAEGVVAAFAIVVAAAMFAAKAVWFPAFPTFAFNFSGNGWNHVSAPFALSRARDLAGNSQAMVALISTIALAIFSRRYLVLPLLVLPLVVLQLLAVRDIIGHFVFYYDMPFLLITAGQFLIAGERSLQGRLHLPEGLALLTASILGSAPLLFAASLPSSLPILVATVVLPTIDLPGAASAVEAALAKSPNACVGYGVAALVPNAIPADRLLSAGSDLASCPTVFLFRGDAHYDALFPKVAGWTPGPVIAGRIEQYSRP